MCKYFRWVPLWTMRVVVAVIVMTIPVEAMAKCLVTIELYNDQRRVPGEVNVECSGCHYHGCPPKHSKYEMGAALLRRRLFTYSWAFLLADGHFSVRFARGQRPGQRPPASFGRPARPDHGARTLRSSPPPPWTFARRFGTLPWEGRCLCDGRSSDDEVLGTCLLGRVGCHQRSSSHGPTLPPCR